MNKEKKRVIEEAIVHHIHHTPDTEGYKREVSINGNIYSVSLNSDFPDETIDFLTKRAMEILKQLIMEGK